MSIKELREAVEAGTDIAWGFAASPDRKAFPEHWKLAMDAYLGSLDAAVALVEAALPGWWFDLSHDDIDLFSANVWTNRPPYTRRLGQSSTPARALLIAALKALEAQDA